MVGTLLPPQKHYGRALTRYRRRPGGSDQRRSAPLAKGQGHSVPATSSNGAWLDLDSRYGGHHGRVELAQPSALLRGGRKITRYR